MTAPASLPDQEAYTTAIADRTPEDGIIVSNLGVSSFTLSAVADRPRNYYMKGAMGSTTPVGLGLAIARDERVTVLDGDGSLLMSLGTLGTVSNKDQENLIVIVMNNSQFMTTGGQPSLADVVELSEAAESCGLLGVTASTIEEFEAAYDEAVAHDGAAVIDCRMRASVPDDYPTPDYGHSYLKHRFRSAVLGRTED
jgi:thiamine pyrophosphate-dependent acetolactate synthase large subunit-like protein